MASDQAYLRLVDERDGMRESIKHLMYENAELREALEFYAARGDASMDDQDGGARAQDALGVTFNK